MSAVRTPAGAEPLVRLDILEEHLDELAYLAIQRRKLCFSHRIDRARFAQHDERILAHRDGLRVAETASLAIAERRLASEDPWDLFAAALTWLELARPDHALLAARLAATPPTRLSSWLEALRRSARPLVESCLPLESLAELSDELRALTVDAAAWHGLLPIARVRELASQKSPAVRAALARTIGTHLDFATGTRDHWAPLLDDPDRNVSRRALWSLSFLKPNEVLERCRRAATQKDVDAFTIRLLGLYGERRDVEFLQKLLADPKGRIAAIYALGDLGYGDAVEALIAILSDDGDLSSQLAATESLEQLLGDLPSASERDRASIDPVPAEHAAMVEYWRRHERDVPADRRRQGGRIAGDDFDPANSHVSMRAAWRFAITRPCAELEWLRKEVPDGFFAGVPVTHAVLGE